MSRLVTKPTKWVCAQRKLRSAWASAQFDQSLRCALNGLLRTQAFFMRTAKSLIRLGGCPGWSESSLGAQSHCWFCHEAAQMDLGIAQTANLTVDYATVLFWKITRWFSLTIVRCGFTMDSLSSENLSMKLCKIQFTLGFARNVNFSTFPILLETQK